YVPQAVLLDAIKIEVSRFVVDGAHKILSGTCQRLREGEDVRHGLRQGKHEVPKGVAREGTSAVENGAVEVFVEGDLSALERRHYHFMPVVEFLFVQMEMLQSRHALSAVPGVGEQDAAYVPEEGLNGQDISLRSRNGLSHARNNSFR